MTDKPRFGAMALRSPPPSKAWKRVEVRPVRTLDDFQKVIAVRSIVYMSEQDCPYEEEFDGNDFAATHLLGRVDGEPVGALRMRWFADFAKLERVCILPSARRHSAVKVMVAHAFEIASRKGYTRMVAQIQARLQPMWEHVMDCYPRQGRSRFSFSDFEYVEIDIQLPRHPEPITPDVDPYVLIRPEGDWDHPGVLDRSVARSQARMGQAA